MYGRAQVAKVALVGLVVLASLAGCRGRARADRNLAGPAPARSPDREAREAVELAQRLLQHGLDGVALAELERAIAINPELETAYIGVGDVYRKRGDFESAEQQYSKAARLEPRSFDAQYLHGLTLQTLNRIAEAVRAYLRALSIRPDDFDANLNLATAYLQLDEPRQALLYASRAVGLRPDNAPARVNLGAVYAALGDYQAAVVEYQQAAELMELTPELLLNLADSLGKVGRFVEMQNTLEQLIRREPSPVAHERLGSAYFRTGRYDDSLEQFRAALAMDPDYYPALNGLGVSMLNRYLLSNKLDLSARDEAVRSLRRSLQVERRQPQVTELLTRYGG